MTEKARLDSEQRHMYLVIWERVLTCWVLCFTSYMVVTEAPSLVFFAGVAWLVEAEIPHNSH